MVARENGFASWAALKLHAETATPESVPLDLAAVALMDEKQTKAFWNKAFMTNERPLTPAERALIAAAVIPGNSRWDGTSDVDRMEAVVKHDPSVLHSIGPALVNMTLSTRGCAPALKFLLDRDVAFLIEEYRAKEGKQYEYDCVHEAS